MTMIGVHEGMYYAVVSEDCSSIDILHSTQCHVECEQDVGSVCMLSHPVLDTPYILYRMLAHH